MADKTQPRSAIQEGRTLDWRHRVRVTKTVVEEVEWESFPETSLQEMSENARQELGLDIPLQLRPEELAPTATAKRGRIAPRRLRINPEPSRESVDKPSPLWTLGMFAIGAVVLVGGVDFLVSKGFDTILAAAPSREGAIGVSRAMGEYLKSLAPFIRVLFDGSILGGLLYKAHRGRRPR